MQINYKKMQIRNNKCNNIIKKREYCKNMRYTYKK